MKTLNNIKNTIIKYKRVFAVLLIVSLSLPAFGVSPDSLRNADNNSIIESERSLESWMINTNLWMFAGVENENEIEGWMTDISLWETIDQHESEMEVEPWMSDAKLWDSAEEAELEVEDWMIDTKYFK